MISVIFTCKGRPELTEICLRRFKELMPLPYELIVVYDGKNLFYEEMLRDIGNPNIIVDNLSSKNRYVLLNEAIIYASGKLFMHLENDFYWVNSSCLLSALRTILEYGVDFVRFEYLPFTMNQFNRFEKVEGHDICWIKPDTPYRFSFNPHIRCFKFPGDKLFPSPTVGESEQMVNEWYAGVSCCMTGDNFRHLGIYDEGGNFKSYYSERFFNERGKRVTTKEELLQEFYRVTDNEVYRSLFREYLERNEK